MSLPQPGQKFKEIKGRAVALRENDIDTDIIIPAVPWLRKVTWDKLAEKAFYLRRHDTNGNKLSHPLNEEIYRGSKILIAGSNFGCGSSREHAPQALLRMWGPNSGFEAVIAESFADIFRGNSTVIGLPLISTSKETIAYLWNLAEANSNKEFMIDLEQKVIRVNDLSFLLDIPESDRQKLLTGTWDDIQTLQNIPEEEFVSVQQSLPYQWLSRNVKSFSEKQDAGEFKV